MIWDFIIDKLTDKHRVFLLLVLESKGSSPGRQGFKMAVASDGSMKGSVGGGIMEHKFVELARARMNEPLERPTLHLQVHDKSSSSRSGMICSGEQTLFIKEIISRDIPELTRIAASFREDRGEVLEVSDSGIRLLEEKQDQTFIFKRCGEEAFLFREKTGRKNILHIVGGGHCGLALSELMASMDFIVRVYDDRPGLNTLELNRFADKKILVNSYDDLPKWIAGGENVYVIIMTFGFRTDDIALRSVMKIPVAYLGMIGSKNKVAQMFDTYRKENIGEEVLNKIHAPAGLPIKSETPEEIAVSIAAEMIRVKNTGQ